MRVLAGIWWARWIVAGSTAIIALAIAYWSSQSKPNRAAQRFEALSLPLHRPETGDREQLPAMARANNEFAVSLYHQLRQKREGNLLISPASLWTGLAMLRMGAKGETAWQIRNAIHLPEESRHWKLGVAALIQDLNFDGDQRLSQVRLANAVWTQVGYPIEESYTRTLKSIFAAQARNVDFVGQPDDACKTINDWTSSRINGKISRILQPEELTDYTKFVWTTSLYVRGSWVTPFRAELTKPVPFQIAANKTVNVPMMRGGDLSHGYHRTEALRVLEAPLGIYELAFDVFLPENPDGLADLEESLNIASLGDWLAHFRNYGEMEVWLPKLRLESQARLDQTLARLGMPAAFDPKTADFSVVSSQKPALFVSQIKQMVYLDIEEQGIEAAAAVGGVSADSFEDEPPVFHADHPFLFVIRNLKSGCILFIGRVIDPLNPAITFF